MPAAKAKVYKSSSKKDGKRFKVTAEFSAPYHGDAKEVGQLFEGVFPDYDLRDFELTVEEVA